MSPSKFNEIELICYKTAWKFLFMFMEYAGPNFEWDRDFKEHIKDCIENFIKNNMGKRNQKEYLDYADKIVDHICIDMFCRHKLTNTDITQQSIKQYESIKDN